MRKQRITGTSKMRRNMKRPGQLQVTEPGEEQIPGLGVLTGRKADCKPGALPMEDEGQLL